MDQTTTQPDSADTQINRSFRSTLLMFALPGIAQGIALHLLLDQPEPVTSFLARALLMVLLVAPTTWFLTTRVGHRLSALVFSLCLGLGTGLLFAAALSLYGGDDAFDSGEIFAISFLANGLICYIAIPFYRTVTERGEAPNHYPSLFEFAWNLPVILATASLFTGVVWLVLWMWTALFNVIGIDFFEELFTEPLIAWAITAGAAAIAIEVVREREGIVLAMRTILFALLKLLAPVVAVVTAVFIVSGLIQGVDNLEVGNWSLTITMISTITVAVVLTNAVLGDRDRPDNTILRWTTRLQSVVLPLLAGVAIYAIWVRLDAYGMTVARGYAAIITGFAAAYGLAYLIGAVLPRGEGFVRQANVVLAGALFLTAILVQTPVINPYQWTVDSQLARLKTGETEPEDFDVGYFRYEMGPYGQKAFEAIRRDAELNGYEDLVERIDLAENTENRWDFREATQTVEEEQSFERALAEGRLILRPADLTLTGPVAERVKTQIDSHCFAEDIEAPCLVQRLDREDLEVTILVTPVVNWGGNERNLVIHAMIPGEDGNYAHELQIGEFAFADGAALSAAMDRIVKTGITEMTVQTQALQIGGETVLYTPSWHPWDALQNPQPAVEPLPQPAPDTPPPGE